MKTHSRLAALAAVLAFAACAQAQTAPAKAASAPAPAAATESNPEMEDAGKMAAGAWLILLDRQDWGTAWDASAALFRQSVPLGMWMDRVPPLRQPLGPLVEREAVETLYKTTLPGHPVGQYVTVRFVSKYEKGALQEIVATVREQDGRWRVIGYQPQPM